MMQDRKTELMKYKAVVAVLRRWLSDGHITIHDYAKLEEKLAVKYRVSLCSIWRELPCRLSENYRRIWYKSAICGIINI